MPLNPQGAPAPSTACSLILSRSPGKVWHKSEMLFKSVSKRRQADKLSLKLLPNAISNGNRRPPEICEEGPGRSHLLALLSSAQRVPAHRALAGKVANLWLGGKGRASQVLEPGR